MKIVEIGDENETRMRPRVWKRRTSGGPLSNLVGVNGTLESLQTGRLKAATGNRVDSFIVDEFWSNGKQRKISAVARRKLSGAKTPVQRRDPKEERDSRLARSRRGGGHVRKPFMPDIGTFLEDFRFSSVYEERNFAIQSGKGGNLNQMCQASRIPASSPSLLDKNLPSKSSSTKQQHLFSSKQQCEYPVTDQSVLNGNRIPAGTTDSAPFEHIDHRTSIRSASPNREARGVHDDLSTEPVAGDSLSIEQNLEDPQVTLYKSSLILTRSGHRTHSTVNSPTPSSNPVAKFLSLRGLEGDIGQLSQRRLSFMSSPSTDSIDSIRSLKGDELNLGEPDADREFWEGEADHAASTKVVESDGLDFGEVDTDRGLCKGETDHAASTRIHVSNFRSDELNFGELDTDRELCGGEKNQAASAKVVEGDELDFAEPDTDRELCEGETDHAASTKVVEDGVPRQIAEVNREVCTADDVQVHCVELEFMVGMPGKTKRKRSTKKTTVEERRNSLEGFGSSWDGGQRRSQRRCLRPLEWWRGEKLLYGRVHTALCSVIGVKHSSPGQYARGISQPFTVESFLPDEHTCNELIRLVAI